MTDKIHLKVLTHTKTVYEDEIDELYVQAIDGRIGFLKNHIPVVCALDYGVAKAVKENEGECISIMGGILQFCENKATILTDAAELECDIDLARAKQAKERAQARLKMKDESVDVKRAQVALARAIARISAKNNKL